MTQAGNLDPEPMLAIRDRYFASSVLAPFAEDMARRLARLTIGPLLEIGADTGVLTQAMASVMSAGLTIIATDPSDKVIALAASKPGMARITWQQAEPHALPFPDATFGIVACHFAIATMPDRIRAFQETRRVMKPNGRFVFSVPGPIRHNPVADCLQTALNTLFPDDPPRFLEHGLHGYADTTVIDDDLTTAGFTDAIYTTVELPYTAACARDVATGYCLGTGLRSEIESRAHGNAEPATDHASNAIEQRFGPGAITSTMRAHIVSASG
jgi:SAM-dependent methyltransferase